MIILITGSSHVGKTALAQKLMEKYKYPYFSIDHLKMGLIRSGNTDLTPVSDDKDLTNYLWPIVREMVKTAIENKQNLIVEGCYIPLDWQKDFEEEYIKDIRFLCLVMSESYIETHYEDVMKYSCVIEQRLFDDYSRDELLADNRKLLQECQRLNVEYLLIDKEYRIEVNFDE